MRRLYRHNRNRATRRITLAAFALPLVLAHASAARAQWTTNNITNTTTTTNNVGVGTTNPEGMLDVGNTDIRLKVTTSDNSNRYNLGMTTDNGRKLVVSSERGAGQQAMVFGDATSNNFFGVSSSMDGGASWHSRFVINQNGRHRHGDARRELPARPESQTGRAGQRQRQRSY
jgi:hypothetical protein